MLADLDHFEPISPTHEDEGLARQASRQLSRFADPSESLRLRLSTVEGDQEIELPASAVKMLLRLLGEMAAGHALLLIPSHAMLTTQQAADQLGVSRPFLVKLLNDGAISYQKVGTHRRIRFHDLMQYKMQITQARHKTLDDLVADGEQLNLDE